MRCARVAEEKSSEERDWAQAEEEEFGWGSLSSRR